MIVHVTPTRKNMIHPLDKILACLPVGREAFLPDRRISHASVKMKEHLTFLAPLGIFQEIIEGNGDGRKGSDRPDEGAVKQSGWNGRSSP